MPPANQGSTDRGEGIYVTRYSRADNSKVRHWWIEQPPEGLTPGGYHKQHVASEVPLQRAKDVLPCRGREKDKAFGSQALVQTTFLDGIFPPLIQQTPYH